MLVSITNLTDGPGKESKEIDVFDRTLSPRDSIRVDAVLIDSKTRNLEKIGYISVGQLPSWYEAYKGKRKGRVLTKEEIEGQLLTTKPIAVEESPKKKR